MMMRSYFCPILAMLPRIHATIFRRGGAFMFPCAVYSCVPSAIHSSYFALSGNSRKLYMEWNVRTKSWEAYGVGIYSPLTRSSVPVYCSPQSQSHGSQDRLGQLGSDCRIPVHGIFEDAPMLFIGYVRIQWCLAAYTTSVMNKSVL